MNEPVPPNDSVVSAFESAWLSGSRPRIADAMASVDDKQKMATLVELVLIDIEFSWKNWHAGSSRPRLLESYVDEFPELANAEYIQKLLEEEYLVRKQCGDQPKYQEFEQRFSHIIDSLQFTQADAHDGVTIFTEEISAGTVIDKFTIVNAIGEGGMGSVFVAEQSDPVKRRVALKVIKKGRNSKEIITRFEAERQALAMMEHPNIARILDGGSTPQGQPYFVMELVDGIPITDYCDEQRLGLNQRLKLFVDVCGAIQHAHQKGVIHRDLKPSNILVAEYDGQPVPKVIDFGLAKALGSLKLLTEQTMATQFGQIVGTFKYMSPEQAGSSPDIDTRTDVYALGIVLYELLTGQTPIDQKTIHGKAMLKLLEIIRDHDPPRPSTKLNSLNDTASTVTDRRQTDPIRLSQILRGDLDWVVMKALEKERQHRYETASSFADDVQRFLNNEPVVARPPSSTYKLRKFVRKNRGLVASVMLITAFLIAAITGTSWFAVRANQLAASENAQRTIADEKTLEAQRQKKIADDARKNADTSAKRSNDVLAIVRESFKTANPNQGANAAMTAREVLDKVMSSLDSSDLDEQARLQLLDTLAVSFEGIGQYQSSLKTSQDALAIRIRTLGKQHIRTVETLNNIGAVYESLGQTNRAIEIHTETLEIRSETLGKEHPHTLISMGNLGNALITAGRYSDAKKVLEQTKSISDRTLGENHEQTLMAMHNLGRVYHELGKFSQSVEILQRTKAKREQIFGMDHPDTLMTIAALADSQLAAGNIQIALDLLEDAVPKLDKKLGVNHQLTISSLSNLGKANYAAGNISGFLEHQKLAAQRAKDSLGREHLTTMYNMLDLASAFQLSGEINQALLIHQEYIVLLEKQLGAEHPQTLTAKHNLSQAYQTAGQIEKAIQLSEEVLLVRERILGKDHVATIISMNGLADSLRLNGQFEKSVAMFTAAAKKSRNVLGAKHPTTLIIMANLAISLDAAGQASEAVPILEDVLSANISIFGENNLNVLQTKSNLASAYQSTGRLEEALELHQSNVDSFSRILGENHTTTIISLQNLALNHAEMGNYEKAIHNCKQAIERYEKTFERSHPNVLLTIANLGVTYRNVGELELSKQLLEEVRSAIESNPQLLWAVDELRETYIRSSDLVAARELIDFQLDSISTQQNPGTMELAIQLGVIGRDCLRIEYLEKAELVNQQVFDLHRSLSNKDWRFHFSQSMLGASYLKVGKVDKSGPLLVDGYNGLKKLSNSIPQTIRFSRQEEALKYLIDLSNANDNEGDVRKWTEELEQLKKRPTDTQ